MAGNKRRVIFAPAIVRNRRMVHGPLNIIWVLIILGAWFTRTGYPAYDRPSKMSNYLIIEKPAALKIYNKYEQKIDPAGSGLFKSFCALQITDPNITLSDNFTLADRVEIDGEYFYLIKNNRQSFDLTRLPGYLKEFRGVQAFGDTVVVSHDGRIFLQSPLTKEKIYLPAGTMLKRIFLSAKMTYIQTIHETRQYGWCNLSDDSNWHRFSPPATALNLNEVLKQIQPVFDRYNSLYRQSFQYFNQHMDRQRVIPYWQVELTDTRLSAKLMNIAGTGSFPNSLPYLVNEIRQHLLNTPLQITQTGDGFEIR
jgi:hypothetical protein